MTTEYHIAHDLARIECKLDFVIRLLAERVINEPALLERLASELQSSSTALASSVDANKPK